MKEWTEEKDGQEFKVVRLPQDSRLTPSATKARTLFQALSTRDKKAYIRERIRRSRQRKRKR